MILNSRNNLFSFSFPRNFIPKEVINLYKPYLNRMPGNLITEPIDLINYSIQGVNLPSVSYDPVIVDGHLGRKRQYRAVTQPQDNFSKEMTVKLQLLDGYINYWIMLDTFNYYYDFQNTNKYLPDSFSLNILDAEGLIIVTIKLGRVLFKDLGSLEMSFSNNAAEFTTFDTTFIYNEFITQIELNGAN